MKGRADRLKSDGRIKAMETIQKLGNNLPKMAFGWSLTKHQKYFPLKFSIIFIASDIDWSCYGNQAPITSDTHT